ncbi:hypothetical protein BSM4216_0665 [Bacillus smithii]|nr:hypothetical protein BSM4216_0665 [Bacillus smithii]
MYFFRFAFFIVFVSRVLPTLSVKKEFCYAFLSCNQEDYD